MAEVRGHANAGYLSLQDLQQYRAKQREPVCGPYKAWRICGMPPPSSGGVAVLQTLGMLEAVQRASPPATWRYCALSRRRPRPAWKHHHWQFI